MKPVDRRPPEEVLLELGRLTWEAIGLESEVYFVCQALKPSPSPTGKPVGARVEQARKTLRQVANEEVRVEVDAWLAKAVEVLQERNAVLHSMPMVFERPDGSDVPDMLGWLNHQPRDIDEPGRYISVSVEGLSAIRLKLEAVRTGFHVVGRALSEEIFGLPPAI